MLNITSWRLLFVDDDQDLCRQIKEFFEGESITEDGHAVPFQVEILASFSDALDVLQAHLFDLLILDVRLGSYDGERENEAGVTTLQAVRERRFIPVVFYTGLPNAVRDLETPLIRVVEKTDMPHLLETVKSIFATHLPVVNRALIRHQETVQRDYMWNFVATHWDKFGNTPDRIGLAYLLARRLAMSLSGPGMQQLLQDLGDSTESITGRDKVHPMQYYIMPPVEAAPLTGDLYYGQIERRTGYWVLLTPSCDMVTGRVKADWILLADCELLTEQTEYQKWYDNLPDPSNTLNGNLLALLQNNRKQRQSERFYYLPGAIDLPDLVIDFQQTVTLPYSELAHLNRLASLDSPFAESLLARFTRYFGRLGIPDLDPDVVLSRLKPKGALL